MRSERYACVKLCPENAVHVRGYADSCPWTPRFSPTTRGRTSCGTSPSGTEAPSISGSPPAPRPGTTSTPTPASPPPPALRCGAGTPSANPTTCCCPTITVDEMTTTDIITYHRERSRHFLDLVEDELARGELEEASNKVWGAAAHAIKAVAESRGWERYARDLLERAVIRLLTGHHFDLRDVSRHQAYPRQRLAMAPPQGFAIHHDGHRFPTGCRSASGGLGSLGQSPFERPSANGRAPTPHDTRPIDIGARFPHLRGDKPQPASDCLGVNKVPPRKARVLGNGASYLADADWSSQRIENPNQDKNAPAANRRIKWNPTSGIIKAGERHEPTEHQHLPGHPRRPGHKPRAPTSIPQSPGHGHPDGRPTPPGPPQRNPHRGTAPDARPFPPPGTGGGKPPPGHGRGQTGRGRPQTGHGRGQTGRGTSNRTWPRSNRTWPTSNRTW